MFRSFIDHFQTKETATVSQIVAKRIPLSCFDFTKNATEQKGKVQLFLRDGAPMWAPKGLHLIRVKINSKVSDDSDYLSV